MRISCLESGRWLPVMAIVVALCAGLPAAGAQSPPQVSPDAVPSASSAANSEQQSSSEEIGDALMLHKRYQAAIEAYKQAPPNSASAWNKMGIAYQMMFNLQEATRCYQKALKLDPHNSHVYNNLGTVYDSLRKYKAAERMYRKALKLGSNSALVNKNLGTNLLTQHKYKQGWEYYKAALAIDPLVFERATKARIDNPGTTKDRGAMNYYMAKSCVLAGMNDRAIEYLRSALNQGFITPKKIAMDGEFAGLRGIPAFDQLLAERGLP